MSLITYPLIFDLLEVLQVWIIYIIKIFYSTIKLSKVISNIKMYEEFVEKHFLPQFWLDFHSNYSEKIDQHKSKLIGVDWSCSRHKSKLINVNLLLPPHFMHKIGLQISLSLFVFDCYGCGCSCFVFFWFLFFCFFFEFLLSGEQKEEVFHFWCRLFWLWVFFYGVNIEETKKQHKQAVRFYFSIF